MTENLQTRRKIAMFGLGGFFILVGLIWFLYWLIVARFAVYTDDAYVNGNMVQIMSQIPGTVIAIHTDDTQLVTQNQTIIQLDPTDMEIALAHAKAQLAQTVRQVRQDFENSEQAAATLILRNADLMKAQQDLKRRTGLVGESAVSREEYHHYQTAEKTAQARYDYALHDLRGKQALVENAHLYTHPLVERAKANLRTAYVNAKRTTIVSPVTGYVAKRSIQLGQHVATNTPMMAIIPLNEIWIEANYKESQLQNLRIDQPVSVYTDAYPSVEYHGKVYGLSAGTGAAFSLLPPQNATGNWIKIVQRLPVRIALDPEELKKHPLQLGLSSHVTVDIHDISGHMLAQKSSTKPVYMTDVYADQLAEANQLIDGILSENAPDMYIPRIVING